MPISPFFDHNDANVALLPELRGLAESCRIAVDTQSRGSATLSREFLPAPEIAAPPPGRVSLGFLMMAHRRFAEATLSRQLRVLWRAHHIFLLHLDARVNRSLVDWAQREVASRPNMRMLARRPVGWGAPSMVAVLVEALTLALRAAPQLSYFINLSDADLPLRTDSELSAFLAGAGGRSFVAVKFPAADRMRYSAHARMRQWTWVECAGEGFVILNVSAAGFFGAEARRCCYARSGPILYTQGV